MAWRISRAMRTKQGYVGLAAGIAEVGDRIELFKGVKLPFLIRPRDSDWELAEDCYVHGIKHREARKQDEAGEQDGAEEQDQAEEQDHDGKDKKSKMMWMI